MERPTGAPGPDVTVVVVPRERFSVALRSLESLLADTERPFELVYVDGGSPAPVRDHVRAESARRGFTLVRTEHYLSPNQARNLGLAHVTTPYVVFLDNDVLVTPGWLTALVDCAEETGAAVVGPLAFEGELADGEVHNAGGFCRFEGEPGRRDLVQENRYGHRPLDELPAGVDRMAVDYVELHCALVRRSVLEAIGGFDEGLRSTREHLDLCLQAKAAGGEVWSAWGAHVTYLNPPPVTRSDLPFFLLRWSEAWNTASLEHFAAKYELGPHYLERAAGMRQRRRVILQPARRAVRRSLGERAERVATWWLDAAERAANTVVVGRLARTTAAASRG